MAKAQATHFYAGLPGYIPNIAEHYDTKRDAIEALRDWADRYADSYYGAYTTGRPYNGRVQDGWIECNGDADIAYVEPCLTPDECAKAIAEGYWD